MFLGRNPGPHTPGIGAGLRLGAALALGASGGGVGVCCCQRPPVRRVVAMFQALSMSEWARREVVGRAVPGQSVPVLAERHLPHRVTRLSCVSASGRTSQYWQRKRRVTGMSCESRTESRSGSSRLRWVPTRSGAAATEQRCGVWLALDANHPPHRANANSERRRNPFDQSARQRGGSANARFGRRILRQA